MEIEIERRWKREKGDEETGKEAEKEKKKRREKSLRYGDEEETEFVRPEAMRPGTWREKQRRERGRTVMSASIGHKKSKHNYC